MPTDPAAPDPSTDPTPPTAPTPSRQGRPTRVTVVPDGPILIEGPVEVVLENGRTVRSDRFLVALCACRRSHAYPWCDTSHRRRTPATPTNPPTPTD
ncbi:CDGSH iron-sulfur domain-containing protein [Peterkaempfera bronchialis]|uniref:CDGSH iron-sulfur domain-containing protein n=1 Tax=Peterkaempfera bronchialis TaxID=2126346 RepID=UPI003C2C5E0E